VRVLGYCILLVSVGALLACAGPAGLREGRTDDRGEGAREEVIEPSAEEAEAAIDPVAIWRAHSKLLLERDDWTAVGKLALRSDTDAFTATLYWRQVGDNYRIRLTGPFGGGGLQVAGDPNGVELETSDNKTYVADNPEELLYAHVGWRVPLSGLRYWIVGRVEPGPPVETVYIDVAGRIVRFEQAGWKIEYSDYTEVDELPMPRKLSMENERIKASVLVNRWEVEPGT
jgi:outer membrane lipoprotein LolB